MNPSLELIDSIYADKVRRARSASIEQKLEAGPRLFEFAHEATRAGIRAQFPGASPEEVETKLAQRLALAVHLEELAWTQAE